MRLPWVPRVVRCTRLAGVDVTVEVTDVYEPPLENVQATVQDDGSVTITWEAPAGIPDDAFYRGAPQPGRRRRQVPGHRPAGGGPELL
jgi:hypothetical protein